MALSFTPVAEVMTISHAPWPNDASTGRLMAPLKETGERSHLRKLSHFTRDPFNSRLVHESAKSIDLSQSYHSISVTVVSDNYRCDGSLDVASLDNIGATTTGATITRDSEPWNVSIRLRGHSIACGIARQFSRNV